MEEVGKARAELWFDSKSPPPPCFNEFMTEVFIYKKTFAVARGKSL